LKNLGDWDPTQNPYYEEEQRSKSWRVEGFGSAPPPEDKEDGKNGIGRLFRRFRNKCISDDELQAMKVATEDTKDKLTLGEQITKAALIVIAPEIFLEMEDGDENKGMYRSLNREESIVKDVPEDPGIVLMNDNKRLRSKISKMEKTMKSLELQASSWKVRCRELESELRRYKGQDSDDSSAEVILEGSDSSEDDGIEEQWTGYDNVEEGNLLGTPSKEEKLENLIELTTDENQLNEEQQVESLIDIPTTNEDVLIDISTGHENDTPFNEQHVENLIGIPTAQEHNNSPSNEVREENLIEMSTEKDEKLLFDPLANGSSQGQSNSLEETEKEKSDSLLEMAGIFSNVGTEDEKTQIAVDKKLDESNEISTLKVGESIETPQNSVDILFGSTE